MATIFVENIRPGYDSQPTRLWFNRDGSFIDGASTIGIVRADTTFSHSRHSPFFLAHLIGQSKTPGFPKILPDFEDSESTGGAHKYRYQHPVKPNII